jgi:hypothetical protein
MWQTDEDTLAQLREKYAEADDMVSVEQVGR